ncbi:FKBP-type peptidyl-prolyl cis-trans isomerase [Rhodoluna sp.]|uniref:FKBP-type peptidyl-prolyl cis-trans isomerase n=1 Tax=Rhodoluna sp. TaxID=1969481 RepID=UPI0025EAB77E|nr:FKBP-type peptidyl-prolyl cis-trans isomerase [Rhodoluna sp.]
MLKALTVIASAALAISLTGCATGNAADAMYSDIEQVCGSYTTGNNAAQIKVSGAAGAVPKVEFANGITSDKIETQIITEGAGPKFAGDQFISLEFIALNGKTGATLSNTSFNGTDAASQLIKSGQSPDFCHALAGVREGSRVAVLLPPKFAHGGQGNTEAGLDADASVVYVIDVKRVYLQKAVGDAQAAEAGMPTVVRAPNGQPGVTQSGKAPKEFKVSTLIKGAGATVAMGDNVTLHYTGIVWGGAEFDSSWSNGSPVQFPLVDGQLIPGFIKALVGQKVGSQVIAVIPPAEGYGATAQGSIPANSTLIFVIDILGTDSAAK